MLIDSHCHVLKEYYSDVPEVLANAKKANVNIIINSAYNYLSSLEVLKTTTEFSNVYGTIGLHPENCLENFDYNIFNNLNNKIVAVGEIGLDYHYGKENKEEQIIVFKKQLDIATSLNLPVVIHSRDATMDTIEILSNYKVKGVIHSFSGSLETAKKYISMGFLLGINGVVTFKNSKLKEILPFIPLESIILETDSPYLTPTPYRGQKNEPCHIKEIATFLAHIYNVDVAQIAEITSKNVKRVFDI